MAETDGVVACYSQLPSRLSTLLPVETRCLSRFVLLFSPLLFGHKASPLSKFRTKFDDGKIGHFKFREQLTPTTQTELG